MRVQPSRVGIVLGLILIAATPSPANAGSQCQTGPGFFDYGPHRDNPEAEQLAMHLSGQLRAPDVPYERIRRDLASIRQSYPILTTVVDYPDYVPDQLLVKLDLGVPWTELDQLNAFYQVIEFENIFSDWYLLTFCDNLNAPALGSFYTSLPEVLNADPNYLIGVDDRITIAPQLSTYRYRIEDGFHDCFDGCDCQRLWFVDVTEAGEISLFSYSESGLSWCVFEDPACCSPNRSCLHDTIADCLSSGGAPMPWDAVCDEDGDGDLLDGACGDNCPFAFNPAQEDQDADGAGDACDNCVSEPNEAQADTDADLVGDLCDNCPSNANEDQTDTDLDRVGDACDNCTLDYNSPQSDRDGDMEGDFCDLDDDLIYVAFRTGPQRVEWQQELGFTNWNLYKGDLAVLRATGEYTQLPGSNDLADRTCGLPDPWLEDLQPPEGGQVAFFLATGDRFLTEFGLGTDSEGEDRPNTNPCP